MRMLVRCIVLGCLALAAANDASAGPFDLNPESFTGRYTLEDLLRRLEVDPRPSREQRAFLDISDDALVARWQADIVYPFHRPVLDVLLQTGPRLQLDLRSEQVSAFYRFSDYLLADRPLEKLDLEARKVPPPMAEEAAAARGAEILKLLEGEGEFALGAAELLDQHDFEPGDNFGKWWTLTFTRKMESYPCRYGEIRMSIDGSGQLMQFHADSAPKPTDTNTYYPKETAFLYADDFVKKTLQDNLNTGTYTYWGLRKPPQDVYIKSKTEATELPGGRKLRKRQEKLLDEAKQVARGREEARAAGIEVAPLPTETQDSPLESTTTSAGNELAPVQRETARDAYGRPIPPVLVPLHDEILPVLVPATATRTQSGWEALHNPETAPPVIRLAWEIPFKTPNGLILRTYIDTATGQVLKTLEF